MGGNPLNLLLGNLFAQGGNVASSEMPVFEVAVVAPDTGHMASPSEMIGTALSNLSQMRPTGNVERDFQSITSALAVPLRVTVSTSTGRETFILPKGATLADIQNLFSRLSALGNQDVLTNPMQTQVPAATALALGSHNVFAPEMPLLPHANPPGHSDVPHAANGQPMPTAHAGESHLPSQVSTAAPQSAALPAGHSELPTARPAINLETIKIPEVVRDVLIRLEILPPGVSTEQALPRLQEVIRLWTAGSQNADLPAEVVHVVSNFLASAVLSTALSNGSTASPQRASQSPDSRAGLTNGSPALPFSEGGRPDFRFGPMTRNDIAKAVMTALAGTSFAPQAPVTGRPSPLGQGAQPPEGPHVATMLPPAPAGAKAGEKDAAGLRLNTQVRTDAGLDRADRARDGKPNARLSGDEHRERAETQEIDLEKRRAAHDQGSHTGSEDLDSHAVEALWQELHAALEGAGFVVASGELRALYFSEEGRAVLNLVSARVPDGWDLIDTLSLVGDRMDLSPEAGAVNAALHRLASYRNTWKGDKVRAVLEPIHDAFVALELVDSEIIPVSESDISAEDLKGFQTHAAAAQMTLDHPSWMVRMGADAEDRGELERILPDIEGLLDRVEDKFAAAEGPAYFAVSPASLPN